MDSYQIADYNKLVNLCGAINSTPLDQLSGAQVSSVITHAEGVKGSSRSWARSILTLHGYNYTSTFELPTSRTRNEVEKEKENTIIFPNPVHDRLNFEAGRGVNTVIVESITGQEMMRIHSEIGQSIDVSSLQNGIYIIKLQKGTQLIETHRFIKI